MAQAPQGQPDALNEGRRNLPYQASPYDIENLLAANGFDKTESIHISVDPVSARNPGYCFVDFPDKATADRVLTSLNAQFNGRSVKVGPCEPKKQQNRRFGRENEYAFNRWGDWNSQTHNSETTASRGNGRGIKQGPTGALHHFEDMVNKKGWRLFVGGLDKMINQAQHNSEIADLFAAFKPVAIGKRITPDEYTRSFPGKHHYCFIDFETKEDMDAAIKTLNGSVYMGSQLKVRPAKEMPKALKDRRMGLGSNRPDEDEGKIPYSDYVAGSSRALESSNWRRKGT
ncbi:hypothetical protein PENSUB_2877 [Penicillium subrubescens]|uniref:RRM domain-containing protein n=1 Tax=Penicillium subrubescens TaxID=1316194 RepID=A0A1Q5UGG6_9EURO|nr:hypothetical protein PENSUB_2877 [Penicillium subrubescens]